MCNVTFQTFILLKLKSRKIKTLTSVISIVCGLASKTCGELNCFLCRINLKESTTILQNFKIEFSDNFSLFCFFLCWLVNDGNPNSINDISGLIKLPCSSSFVSSFVISSLKKSWKNKRMFKSTFLQLHIKVCKISLTFSP